MKILKKDNKNIQYGFVCAGYSPTASKTIFSQYGRAYLHIILLKVEKMYICNGMTAFNKHKIPFPFKTHEFSEFYGEKPPKLSNNRKKAVNELVLNIVSK